MSATAASSYANLEEGILYLRATRSLTREREVELFDLIEAAWLEMSPEEVEEANARAIRFREMEAAAPDSPLFDIPEEQLRTMLPRLAA